MELKVVYFITTSGQRWGKGLTLAAAMKAAGLKQMKTDYRKGQVEINLAIAVFKKETTDEELVRLAGCLKADDFWGNAKFYDDDSHPDYESDMALIEKLFLGWTTDYISFRMPKKEKETA